LKEFRGRMILALNRKPGANGDFLAHVKIRSPIGQRHRASFLASHTGPPFESLEHITRNDAVLHLDNQVSRRRIILAIYD